MTGPPVPARCGGSAAAAGPRASRPATPGPARAAWPPGSGSPRCRAGPGADVAYGPLRLGDQVVELLVGPDVQRAESLEEVVEVAHDGVAEHLVCSMPASLRNWHLCREESFVTPEALTSWRRLLPPAWA